ncbi:MAG: Gfo/Idh/MocA family oxidoreductase [Deltaproteobacteria bacterium]|nr:Gfo/Idh/MocA family oxidoreductase [Deltaproteobacteria bacterium]
MRVGIIGCGLIGKKRAEAAQGHEITRVADIRMERAEELAALTGARPAREWEKVVEAEDVDCVVVAVSHDKLAEITLNCVNAGKHVLVEKPAARSLEELRPVIEAIEKKGVVLKVGFNHRFHPALLKAKEIFDSGGIGHLMFVRGRYGHGGRPGYEKEWRANPAVSGGGELIDQGVHLIDLARWFLGDFSHVDGFVSTYFWDMLVDDNSFLALRTPAGEMAWLHASWTEWKNLFSFEIYGRQGKLEINGLGGSYGVERLSHYRMSPAMGPPHAVTWEYPFPDNSWRLEFEEFVNAINKRRTPCGNIFDAASALEIVGRIYRKNYDYHA